MAASASPSERPSGRTGEAGGEDDDEAYASSGATSASLLRDLAADLADAPSGMAFVYDALRRLAAHHGWDDLVLVVDDADVGRQVFRANRRAPWEGHVRLVRDLLGGLFADGEAVRDPIAESLADLCRVALRMDLFRHDASHDPLTGLLNRRSFDEALVQSTSRSVRYGWPFALVVVDLDNFKALNDRRGHDVGDQVLRAMGAELRRSLRAGDVAARLGGDEFAIIVAKGDAELVHALTRRLHAAVAQVADGEPTAFSAGVALAPAEATDAGELFRLADRRLYEAKAR